MLVLNVLKVRNNQKADWQAIDSPKKRTDEFVLIAFLLFTGNKSNSSVYFFGEATARQSGFWFYLTFGKFAVSSNGPKGRFKRKFYSLGYFLLTQPFLSSEQNTRSHFEFCSEVLEL